MSRAFRIAFHACILLAFVVFVGCSDDDPATPTPEPQQETSIAGTFGGYTDDAGTDRNVVDTGGLVTLYVFHKITGGTMASAFKIDAPEGWTLVGTDHQFILHIGDVGTGIAYAYQECLTGSIHLATLTYQSPGNSAGSSFEISPYTGWDNIRVVDCNEHAIEDGIGLSSVVSQP